MESTTKMSPLEEPRIQKNNPSLEPTLSWDPFSVLEDENKQAPPPRSIETKDGIGDRLRAAAFAEIQAREAFLWASETFTDAPESLKKAWRGLALAEDKHLNWLLNRMKELEIDPKERSVSLRLWHSFMQCETAREFALFMSSAEERGRKAGERFYEAIKTIDPISAEIFRKIAEEEIEHIELAKRYFPS